MAMLNNQRVFAIHSRCSQYLTRIWRSRAARQYKAIDP